MIFSRLQFIKEAKDKLHKQWSYLKSDVMMTRYAVVTDWLDLKRCAKVVEIGCYYSPLKKDLPESCDYIAVDPLVKDWSNENGTKKIISGKIEDLPNLGNRCYNIVCLGMDLKGDDSMKQFIQLAQKSSSVICGFAMDWDSSMGQYKELVKVFGEPDKSLELDFKGNSLRGKPYYRRLLCQWEIS